MPTLKEASPYRPVRRLFWDLETSPNVVLSWRAGYKINITHDSILKERAIICVCWKWEGESKVHHLEWDKGCDKNLLKEFLKVVEDADEMIAHNGDKFDLKWFNTRCLFHGLNAPAEAKTVDTLVIARRRFYLNSNRLDYLGKFLFGTGKADTGGFQTWKDIVLNHCPKAMRKMVKYCKEDVRLLERVWNKIQVYHKDKTHAGVLKGEARWTCPHDGSLNVHLSKTKVTAAGTKQYQMRCKDCGKYYTISDSVFREYLEYKHDKASNGRKSRN